MGRTTRRCCCPLCGLLSLQTGMCDDSAEDICRTVDVDEESVEWRESRLEGEKNELIEASGGENENIDEMERSLSCSRESLE